MRTDVKVGIALGAILLIVAVTYYGSKKEDNINLADNADDVREENRQILDSLFDSVANHKEGDSDDNSDPDSPATAQRQDSIQAPQNTTKLDSEDEPVNTNPSTQGDHQQHAEDTLGSVKDLDTEGGHQNSSGSSNPPVQPELVSHVDLSTVEKGDKQQASGQLELPFSSFKQSETTATQALDQERPRGAQGKDLKRAVPVHKATNRIRQHVVSKGDTFSGLSVRYYGQQKYARYLADANPSVDPYNMKIGVRLEIPPLPHKKGAPSSATQVRTPGKNEYKIKSGDSFYSIASKLLGSGSQWKELYELNRAEIGDDPAKLKTGMIIKIPSEKVQE